MSERKETWTKGPWFVDNNSRDIQAENGTYVVYGFARDNTGVLNKADARLIAAAPDLYEALIGIIEMAEDLAAIFPIKLNDEGLSAVDRARSALLLAHKGGTENG